MATEFFQRLVLERFLNRMEAYAYYHYLDANGIAVSISDPPLTAAMGEIPFVEITTLLYLENPAQLDEARSLIHHYRSGKIA